MVLATGKRIPGNAGIWLAFVGMGFINNLIPFTLIVWGQTHIASGLASILNAITPLFTIIVAHLFTSDEALFAQRVAGIGAGMTGADVWAAVLGLALLSTAYLSTRKRRSPAACQRLPPFPSTAILPQDPFCKHL